MKLILSEYHGLSHTITCEFGRIFTAFLDKHTLFLNVYRPLSVSMHHAIKFLKYQLLQVPIATTYRDAAIELILGIDNYIYENIEISGKAISLNMQGLIQDDDVIITYGCSSLVERVITDLHAVKANIKVNF